MSETGKDSEAAAEYWARMFAAEERRAWDAYAAGAIAATAVETVDLAAGLADGLLAERRKRFPPPGEGGA